MSLNFYVLFTYLYLFIIADHYGTTVRVSDVTRHGENHSFIIIFACLLRVIRMAFRRRLVKTILYKTRF